MASTSSVQAHHDAERDFIDSMVPCLDYTEGNPIQAHPNYTEGNPIQAHPDYMEGNPIQSHPDYTEGNLIQAHPGYSKENPIQAHLDYTEGIPIQDDNQVECWKYQRLYKAIVEGDWEKAKKFFEKNQDAITANINSFQDNALQIAVQAGNKAIDFVKNLVEEMPIEALDHQNFTGHTALSKAAIFGNTRAAVILVRKRPQLLYIGAGEDNYLPVHLAAEYGNKDTFQYYLSVTQEEQGGVRPFAGNSGVYLVGQVIFSGYYDEALKLIERHPELAKLQLPDGRSALSAIACMESVFPSGSYLSFWENAIYSCVPVKLDEHTNECSRFDIEDPVPKHNLPQTFVRSFYIPVSQRLQAMPYKVLAFLVPLIKRIGDKKQEHYQATRLVKLLCEQITTLNDYKAFCSILSDPLLSAARLGVKEVVEEILDMFPDAAWFSDDKFRSAFELAILHRQEKVFSIIYQMDLWKHFQTGNTDKEGNNMLHLAGKLAPQSKLNHIPGAALQMQRELQWYKEVEKLLPPTFKLVENNDGETPGMVFTIEHEQLVREGEKWMKDAANSCTIVASLIATIAFAAAITSPGGNDNNTGLPIFSKESTFIIFTISNALSLFTAATSLLTFLSILTSRYTESDFLSVLPKRLIIGLVTLFLSITTMMVAFTAILYLVAGKYKKMILIPATTVASVPIYIFMSWQFSLLLDLIYSTYGTIFGKKNDSPIFLRSHRAKWSMYSNILLHWIWSLFGRGR